MVKRFEDANAEGVDDDTPTARKSRFSPFEDKADRRREALGKQVWGSVQAMQGNVPPEEVERLASESQDFFKNKAVAGVPIASGLLDSYSKALNQNNKESLAELWAHLDAILKTGDADKVRAVVLSLLANVSYLTRRPK